MAIGGSAAGERATAGHLGVRVVNLELRPAAARRQGGGGGGDQRVVVAAVQGQMPDLMSFFPEATRVNAHVVTIWHALDYVEGDDTE